MESGEVGAIGEQHVAQWLAGEEYMVTQNTALPGSELWGQSYGELWGSYGGVMGTGVMGTDTNGPKLRTLVGVSEVIPVGCVPEPE